MKRKLYIFFSVLLISFMALITPIKGYCATNIDNWRKDLSWVEMGQTGITVFMPDNSSVDFTYNVEFGNDILLYYRPNNKNTFLGEISFTGADLLALQPSINFILPVAKYDNQGNFYYDLDNWEFATLIPNNPYPKDGVVYKFCGDEWDSFGGCQTRPYDNTNSDPGKLYSSFMIKNINNYLHPNGTIFTGSYDYVWNNYDRYDYVCYVLQTLKYLVNNPSILNSRSDIIKIQKIYADGFSHLNTEEYKLYQETLKNAIDKGTEDIENKLDDMTNMGSGQFDDIKTEMDNATDKADQSNDILNDEKENRPSADDVENSVTNIIDDVLSNEETNSIFNRLMGLLFSQTIFIGFISIAVASGVIKYIFYGKG